MNKMATVCLVMAILGMGAWVWTGCESAGGTGGVAISPSSKVLGGESSNATSVVDFTAQVTDPLALPLSWRVSNAALGNIISASGSNATYKANSGAKGDNVITVRDQYENEGSAVVTQQ